MVKACLRIKFNVNVIALSPNTEGLGRWGEGGGGMARGLVEGVMILAPFHFFVLKSQEVIFFEGNNIQCGGAVEHFYFLFLG